MRKLLTQALTPALGLIDCLKKWRDLCQRLGEPPRKKRGYQLNQLRSELFG
jgi:hypothetical protein